MDRAEVVLTGRLRLVPATVEVARAEIGDRPAFAALLDASVPDSWPPEMLADALPFFLRQLEAAPERSGWLAWYGILRGTEDEPATLVASAGFIGPPHNGAIEVGYSVLPEYQQRGLATEMVAGLVEWAFAHPEVRRIAAEIHYDNTPSLRLVHTLGFSEVGDGEERGYRRFELMRPVNDSV